jgi:hypothetical protein
MRERLLGMPQHRWMVRAETGLAEIVCGEVAWAGKRKRVLTDFSDCEHVPTYAITTEQF